MSVPFLLHLFLHEIAYLETILNIYLRFYYAKSDDFVKAL